MKDRLFGVVFKNNSKPYYFTSELDLRNGDEVVVETEKGLQYGKIVSQMDEKTKKADHKPILRKATEEDKEIFYHNLKDADSALRKCRELAKKLELDMFVINANFNFDRSQLLINFSADDRVDFRELAKKLASIYRTRIELRQIGARDKAKIVGGVGVCGQELCCTRFLKQIDSISMNKAKNQNLALNPSKINGCCGRLLCCLDYEDEEYTRQSKGLYPVGTTVKVNGEEATIVSVDILSRSYKALIGDEKKTIFHKEIANDRKK